MTDIRLGVVRGITYGRLGAPEVIAPQTRSLGAGLTRVFLYWAQIEPAPGRYVWDAVDALREQFGPDGDHELWITVGSVSTWATRISTDFIPTSPAKDLDAYAEFVRRLVERFGGRVKYWQPDNEPSIPFFWKGTAAEYVAQLEVFHRAVKSVDPAASVVLGGCPPGPVSPAKADDEELAFFGHLLDAGRDFFDVFDVHLYGDPYEIPAMVEAARELMRGHGYEKPVVAGEYNGPVLFQYPELFAAVGPAFAENGVEPFADLDLVTIDSLLEKSKADTPQRLAMKQLYASMPDLPPKLQMFMAGCPETLELKRHRMQGREIVVRNLLAMSAGVRRTACWNLGSEGPGLDDPYDFMRLMFDKFKLMDYEDGELSMIYPAAETFARLAGRLEGAQSVTRVEVPAHPDRYVFEVRRTGRDTMLVAWDRRDDFTGRTSRPWGSNGRGGRTPRRRSTHSATFARPLWTEGF